MIYTIGESVLDIIIKDFDNVRIRPGGSMLNTAISLGRLGLPVCHISNISNDEVSNKVIDFLKFNNVSCQFILKDANKTNLALAFLDDKNNASYTFYKEKPDEDVNFNWPKISSNDYILFGSFFCLNPAYRKSIISFLKKAKENGAKILYDPNYRKTHLNELPGLKNFIIENFEFADFVKASDEDLKNIFNVDNGEEAFTELKKMDVKALYYTKGEQGADLIFDDYLIKSDGESVKPLSTIGAGDTFSAGLLYYLNNFYKENELQIFLKLNGSEMLKVANLFASKVCMSYDNYLSIEFVNEYLNVQ